MENWQLHLKQMTSSHFFNYCFWNPLFYTYIKGQMITAKQRQLAFDSHKNVDFMEWKKVW
jgi:hypothetical protein